MSPPRPVRLDFCYYVLSCNHRWVQSVFSITQPRQTQPTHKNTMARNVINRSISFDPQLFEKMEQRRGRLLMQRSEYVTRCVIKDMMGGGDMNIAEVPSTLVQNPNVTKKRESQKRRK